MAKRSKAQKRKRRQLQQRQRRTAAKELQPYHGNKYRKDKYVLAIMEAEVGIYETYVMTDRELTDWEVVTSIKNLIRELRSKSYQLAEEGDEARVESSDETDMVQWSIKHNWDNLFTEHPRHSDTELVGILRTILGSVEVWSTYSPNSRGYLNYIEGFLSKAGVQVERSLMEGEEEVKMAEVLDEEYLLNLGLEWLNTHGEALKQEFFAESKAMLDGGQAEEVINVCQYLIGQVNDLGFINELVPLLQPAYRQLGVPFRTPSP